MDEQEAIEDLKKLADCNVIQTMMFNVNHGEQINMAIAALEKQVAKKPDAFAYVYGDRIGGYCQICKRLVLNNRNFCSNCGQKIDWEEE